MSSSLSHWMLQHHASCISLRRNMHSASSRPEDETCFDDGLVPKALNIRRSYLHQTEHPQLRRARSQSGMTSGSQESTPRGPRRVVNLDVNCNYNHHDQIHRRTANHHQDHRRVAMHLPSAAQRALQRVARPHSAASSPSSRSRISSLGSYIVNTIRRHKPTRKPSAVSTEQDSAQNPLRAPPATVSDTESQSAGDLSRSVSSYSQKSSIAEPRTAPIAAVAPFEYTEPAQVSPLEYLTPGGIAAAKLELQSFTTISGFDAFHRPPTVTVWGVVTVNCVKLVDGMLDYNHSVRNRAQLALRSHGQIANLVLEVTPPAGFDIVCVLGRLQHRQLLMGSTWSVIFKLQPHREDTMSKIPRGAQDSHPNTAFATDRLGKTNRANRKHHETENDRLMDEVEGMLMPEEKLTAQVQYSHNLFPSSTTVRESGSCAINAMTETERRHRQFYEQQGQISTPRRGTSTHTTNNDLERDLQTANAICAVLQEGVGAKWPQSAQGAVKYTTISHNDAIQLLCDFREAAGATLPQEMTEEMDRLKSVYREVRKETQERLLSHRGLKAVHEVGKRAGRALLPSTNFTGRKGYDRLSVPQSPQHLDRGRTPPENRDAISYSPISKPWDNLPTLEDVTNATSRRRGVARFVDTLPTAGRRSKVRTDTTTNEAGQENIDPEEDDETQAIWRKVHVTSHSSSVYSDDAERVSESQFRGPPWL